MTPSRNPSYLHRSRHGAFGFRVVVPRDLRDRFPHPEFRVSLRTRDNGEARRLAHGLAFHTISCFRRIRELKFDEGAALGQKLLADMKAETPEAVAGVLRNLASWAEDPYQTEMVERVAVLHQRMETTQELVMSRVKLLVNALPGKADAEIDALTVDAMFDMKLLKDEQTMISAEMSSIAIDLQSHVHDRLLSQQAVNLSAAFDNERTRMNAQSSEMLAMVLQRSGSAPAAAMHSPVTQPEPPQKPRISQVLADLLEDKESSKRSLKEESVDGYRDTLDLFIEHFGDIPASAVDRKVGAQFVEMLKKLPPSRNKNPAYRAMSLKQSRKYSFARARMSASRRSRIVFTPRTTYCPVGSSWQSTSRWRLARVQTPLHDAHSYPNRAVRNRAPLFRLKSSENFLSNC